VESANRMIDFSVAAPSSSDRSAPVPAPHRQFVEPEMTSTCRSRARPVPPCIARARKRKSRHPARAARSAPRIALTPFLLNPV